MATQMRTSYANSIKSPQHEASGFGRRIWCHDLRSLELFSWTHLKYFKVKDHVCKLGICSLHLLFAVSYLCIGVSATFFAEALLRAVAKWARETPTFQCNCTSEKKTQLIAVVAWYTRSMDWSQMISSSCMAFLIAGTAAGFSQFPCFFSLSNFELQLEGLWQFFWETYGSNPIRDQDSW